MRGGAARQSERHQSPSSAPSSPGRPHVPPCVAQKDGGPSAQLVGPPHALRTSAITLVGLPARSIIGKKPSVISPFHAPGTPYAAPYALLGTAVPPCKST